MQTHGQGPDRTQCTAVSVDTSHDITRAHTCARVHVCCMRMPAQHTRVAHLRDLVVELEELEPGERLVDAAAQGPYVCSCRPAQLQHRFGRSILPRSYQRHAPVRARDRRPEIHNLDRRDPVERVAVDLRKGARDDEVACNSSARVESDTGWSETRADFWAAEHRFLGQKRTVRSADWGWAWKDVVLVYVRDLIVVAADLLQYRTSHSKGLGH
eukprot:813010-Rhodomonas_salina.3